jgi:ethanolamine utilization protein EutQ (cupin superfamily)
MTVYSYRSNELQFNESDKLPMTEVYLKDVVDSSTGSESMSAGLAKYAKGVSNSWTLDYDEFIIVISGVFTIHSEGNKSSTLRPGDFFFITRGTSVTYQADEASLLMYVTYPPWREAARKAGRL